MRNPNDSEANEPLRKLDPTFCEMAVQMGSRSWGIKALSQREKALLCLVADICDHNLGLAFEMHFSMALANEVPLMAIKEVIFHAAPEAGYANALRALIRFKELCNSRHLNEAIDEPATQMLDVDSSLAGDLSRLDPRFEEAWRTGVMQQWVRPNITLQERSILSVAAAVSNQTLGVPFKHFVNTALRHGVTPDRLRAAVSFMGEFGFGKAWQGLEVLCSILPDEQHEVDPIPYRATVPYLSVKDGWAALSFYNEAFGAEEVVRLERQGGRLAHAELRIGDATFMVREEYPEHGYLSPSTIGGTPVNLLVYVRDVRRFAERAASHGAEIVHPVKMEFHKDRMRDVADLLTEMKDPFDHSWFFATRLGPMVGDGRSAASRMHPQAMASA